MACKKEQFYVVELIFFPIEMKLKKVATIIAKLPAL